MAQRLATEYVSAKLQLTSEEMKQFIRFSMTNKSA